jgi:[NiFe] hydrogenase large subunit
MQAEAAAIIAVMGGKFPHFMTSLPGGTTFVPTEAKLDDVLFRLTRLRDWITNTMIPDTLAIAPFYAGALEYGQGVGNFLAWGVYEGASMDPADRFLPRGAILDGKLELAEANPAKVLEYVDRSWYEAGDGDRNPAEGTTNMAWTEYDTDDRYSWIKAPRYDGRPMEVGPLARMLVAYLAGREPVQAIVDGALDHLGASGKPEVLVSLLGRVAARNLEAKVVADQMMVWVDELLQAIKGGDSSYFVESDADAGSGAGLWEAPRGAVGHWMTVKDGRIDRYQVVTPSTWDVSPRDGEGVRGPMEEALVGTPIEDPEQPFEALRIVHSFDP